MPELPENYTGAKMTIEDMFKGPEIPKGETPCERCHGFGKIVGCLPYLRKPCPDCNGSGWKK
jgi:DnaJ-class molecular chaperone